MKVYDLEDTIAAIATPLGEGGIGIIRISGPLSLSKASNLFRPKKQVKKFESHRLYYGDIIEPSSNEVIDEVLLSYMKAPGSFTGDDVVEINCHGGSLVLKRIMEILLREGAREATPGEFSKRAYLNGRMDLSQAEAVIDIIRAKTDQGLRMASRHLKGDISHSLKEVKDNLIDVLAVIEAYIDFPEEDLEEQIRFDIGDKMLNSIKRIRDLLDTYEEGRICREGIHVVIAGRPNVGKSTLLNVLLKEKRAIVTSIPGTTRDVIEEIVNIKGIPVNLIDTAGIRDTEDAIEEEGIRRTREKLADSDLVLYMLDERGLLEEDISLLKGVEIETLLVINKSDIISGKELKRTRSSGEGFKQVEISAKEGAGIEDLKESIYDSLLHHDSSSEPRVTISRNRHKVALEISEKALKTAIEGVEKGSSYEFIAADIKESLNHIGEVVGETTSEDVLDRVFSEFCIGK